jgi:enoyl-CoA hydratase
MSSENDDAPVLVERRGAGGRLGVLTLNRPKAINALTHEMVGVLTQALVEWTDDPSVKTVLLVGAGERGLCAGGDIVSIHRDAVSGGTGSEDFWRDEYDLNALIADYPKPYVALMDGIVLGGGVGVSAHASHRVVTERTRIGMPETGIGFVPDVGGTWLLSHAPGELGTYVALTAGHVDAGDAIELGLADHFVPAAEVARLTELLEEGDVTDALAQVAHAPPPSRLAKQRDWIDEAFAPDDVATILAILSKSSGSEAGEAAAAMRRNSPTALAVTLRALRDATRLDGLRQALDQEYRIAVRMLRGHDFPEGIRAQVIDKDRNPQWEPASIADVTPAAVDRYFAPLPNTLEDHA